MGLAYSVGLSARHSINTRYDLFSSLAYFGSSQVRFNELSTTRSYSDGERFTQSVLNHSYSQVFSSLNLYIGVGIKL